VVRRRHCAGEKLRFTPTPVGLSQGAHLFRW
jgi:hypothetical protein